MAIWRFELLEPILLERSRQSRRRAISRLCRTPILWLDGATRRVAPATVYRWLAAYRQGGIDALQPRPRKDRGKPRARLPQVVVTKALRYLTEDPGLSLPLVIALLATDPEIKPLLETHKQKISRSTLSRRLKAKPEYARLRRLAKSPKPRIRYAPRRPHQIWHLDSKGPATIKLVSGEELTFHVLTILDGATRAVLASRVVAREDTKATVLTFRSAAARWGLADTARADRGSAFDSHVFRYGVALLGCCRLWVKPRDPESNGKIEAFHRFLARWFFRLLGKQEVVDAVHLQQLLDVVIEHYMDHPHRELGRRSPRMVLGDVVSRRAVSLERLRDAFCERVLYRAHPKTGEVDLKGGRGKYLVPPELRGQTIEVLLDPDPEIPPLVLDPTGRRLPLRRVAVQPEDAPPAGPRERWGAGLLQKLHDQWHGKVRPVAEPGFGLPEIFQLLAGLAGRPVPRTEAEAAVVMEAYRKIGPLPRRPAEVAFAEIGRELGPGRPLSVYLDALARRVVPTNPKQRRKPR